MLILSDIITDICQHNVLSGRYKSYYGVHSTIVLTIRESFRNNYYRISQYSRILSTDGELLPVLPFSR